MTIDTLLKQFESKAQRSAPIGKSLKFVLDGTPIFIDGYGSYNTVTVDNTPADCTLTMSVQTLQKLRAGRMSPVMAMMRGKVKIKGDMTVAMKLKTLLKSKLEKRELVEA